MDRATVLYDADCGFCRWSTERLRVWDRHRALRFVPLQHREVDRLLHDLSPERRAASWHLVEPDGSIRSAGAAVPPLMRRLPAGTPIAALAESMPRLTDRVYAAVARRRSMLGSLLGRQSCDVHPTRASTTGPAPRDAGR
ncbi:MAG: thiol-disulfide oxidoreductase DCC family protein [Actinomycetota bacterium]